VPESRNVPGRWRVDHWRGPAGVAHGEVWPAVAAPAVRVIVAEGPALVLGSTQDPAIVDTAAAASEGIAVVRRRSGGGAVLVGTGDIVWIDVFVPAGDPLWDRDVGRATHWLGRAWTDALATFGVAAEWHDGPLVTSVWSSLVCFAGMGPGEVRVGGAKAVGVSQRRTRAGALFQCAALLAWDPAPTLDLLVLDDDDRRRAVSDLAGVAGGIGVSSPGAPSGRRHGADEVQEAFVGTVATL